MCRASIRLKRDRWLLIFCASLRWAAILKSVADLQFAFGRSGVLRPMTACPLLGKCPETTERLGQRVWLCRPHHASDHAVPPYRQPLA